MKFVHRYHGPNMFLCTMIPQFTNKKCFPVVTQENFDYFFLPAENRDGN